MIHHRYSKYGETLDKRSAARCPEAGSFLSWLRSNAWSPQTTGGSGAVQRPRWFVVLVVLRPLAVRWTDTALHQGGW